MTISNRDELVIFEAGQDWDAAAHVRLLRQNGGASSGYTADLIERLHTALRSLASSDGEPEPVAWIDFADGCNVRLWTNEKSRAAAEVASGRKMTPVYTAPPADAGMREAYSALCLPRESQASDNLDGALYDIERLSAQGKPTDDICIRTLKRVLKQIVRAEQALTAPGATTKSDGSTEGRACSSSAASSSEDVGLVSGRDQQIAVAGVEPCPSDPSSTRSGVTALADIAKERQRQRGVEGWSSAHDDAHDAGEMASAAACYALSATGLRGDDGAMLRFWPWDDHWWKPSNRRRDLIKAGALIVAEIERLDRLDQFEIRRK